MKEAEKIQIEVFGAVDDAKLLNRIALALDQREQSVWEEALKELPEDHLSFSTWNDARAALLSARSKSLKE